MARMNQKTLLESLHEIQDLEKKKNYLPLNKMTGLSQQSRISLAKIYGVLTYYTMYSDRPRGRHLIRLCGNLPCHLDQVEKVKAKITRILGIDFGQTTADGLFTLEQSSCLGMCAESPAMTINDIPFGHLTPAKAAKIIADIKSGEKS